MAITPEQVKNQEFPIRLKGYDPDDVRSFLLEVGSAYRATIRDSGAQWALNNISDDMAAVLRAAHDAAEKVIASAEADAADVRAKAEIEATVIRREVDTYAQQTRDDADAEAARAIEVLKRTQGQAAGVSRDAGEARTLLEEAQAKADAILATADASALATRRAAEKHAEQIEAQLAEAGSISERAVEAESLHTAAIERYEEAQQSAAALLAEAETRALRLRDDADSYAAERRREAMEDREEARVLLERTDERAQAMIAEAEEQAAAIKRLAEREARTRVLQIQEQASQIGEVAEGEARERVQSVLAEGQRRLDAIEQRERQMQGRILAAQQEFQSIVHRLGSGSDDTTIDLTTEPVAVLGGRYDEGLSDDLEMDDSEFLKQMVSAAVGRAADHSGR